MPPRYKAPPIGEKDLQKLAQKGSASDMLWARLDYASYAVMHSHHVQPLLDALEGDGRIYPSMLPTQASGRWSTTEPPLVNFTGDPQQGFGPKGIRDMVKPDPGWQWLKGDLDAIEAKVMAAAAHDRRDLEAFRRKWDIHTITAIRTWKWPEPPFEPTKANLFKSSAGKEWCLKVSRDMALPEPYSSDSRTRRLAKNALYSMNLGENEHSMSLYATAMRMPKADLLAVGRAYLAAKPNVVAFKQRYWQHCKDTSEARTWLGRRRRLFGTPDQRAKAGLAHAISGTVSDMMNGFIIAIAQRWPDSHLVVNRHDGFEWAFPVGQVPMDEVRGIVEVDWSIEGEVITSTADWEIIGAS